MKIQNPLYVKSTIQTSTTKNVTTARIENTHVGVCPKCNAEMSTSQLGQSLGNQRVYFCNTCHVCTPMPN